MRNKGLVVFLTIIISILCFYFLFLTKKAGDVRKQAIELATDADQNIDYSAKQTFLDSVWKEPVLNFLGLEYTYEELKEDELSLGLDLQGGMHVTLEVTPVGIIQALSGNNGDQNFKQALKDAGELQKSSQKEFVDLFYESYQKLKPGAKLNNLFATSKNQGKIDYNTSDEDVLKVIRKEIDDAVDRSFEILRTRINRFGTSQPNIQKLQGSGRIQVEIPGADNPARVRKLLQGVAKLEFLEVWELREMQSSIIAIENLLLKEEENGEEDIAALLNNESDSIQAELEEFPAEDQTLADALDTTQDNTVESAQASVDSSDSSEEDLAAQLEGNASDSLAGDSATTASTKRSPFLALNKTFRSDLAYAVKDTMTINRILKREDVQLLLPPGLTFLWTVKPEEQQGEEILELVAVKKDKNGRASIDLQGDVIKDANPNFGPSGQPEVSMRMNAIGAKKWKKITGENKGKRIAIVLDDYVYSAPVVQGEIPNGNSSISGNFTIDEAKDLANILKSGSLPAPTRIVEEAVIGPTLGKEAQRQGITSMVAGLAIVVLFMIAYYAKGGFLANLALIFNVFFVLGILAQFSAALTLPGIAGIVLTIGMSIDANVLIFERIREELRNGMGLMSAISAGYNKAFSSIVDSNATTLLTGFILLAFGQGPVRSFAVTLIIGIISSFFSAVFITRVLVEALSKKGDQSKISFATPFAKNALSNLNINFLGKRKMAYLISGVFIAAGIAVMATNGLNLGVDFKGGRSYVVNFSKPMVASDMKVALASSFGGEGTEVKTYGTNSALKVTTSYLTEDESDEADAKVLSALISGVSDFTKLTYIEDASKVDDQHFSIGSSSKVGATIADDIKQSSIKSAIIALIVIFIYILIRFRKWQFGLGAIIALFHDTLVVLSAFAFARLFGISYEVDQVFIAAVLTIIGYSINDTVIVFDRIRETLSLKKKAERIEIFNLSINNTLSRTLITSITTLIVVIILFLFGGEVLKGFSFALLVGIIVGTYSSVYIATPVVIDLDKSNKSGSAAK